MSREMETEKILVLSDIHGNGPALGAILGAEPGVSRILCLGDYVNYGPDPGEVLRWARATLREGDYVSGNHARIASSPDEPIPPGVPQVASELLHYTRARLRREELLFLRELPPSADLQIGGRRWHLVHALPSDPFWGQLHHEARPQRWALEVALAGFPEVLLVGHTHRPFLIERGGTVIVNPGSVGRPKDGDPRASYAVWEEGRFHLRRVDYRISETEARLSRHFRGSLLAELSAYLRRGGKEIFDEDMAA